MTPRCPPPKEAPPDSGKVFVLGVSGASGAPYAVRVLEQVLMSGATVHCVVSEYGQRLLFDELGVRKVELAQLCPNLVESPAAAGEFGSRFIAHPNKDVGAVIASGSFLHDGMAVLPCSSTSLGAIATGAGSNLLTRAAYVTLKERRPLILVPREAPLPLPSLEAMVKAAQAGATILPASPGFYHKPQNIEDLLGFITQRILDLLDIPYPRSARWKDEG